MKISKKILIYLAGGILVIIIAGLLVAYSQHYGEQSQLKDDLALAQLRLQKYPAQQLSSQQKDMTNQLAQAELQLIAAKAGLYQSTESIEATDLLFALAEDCNVEIAGISSPGLATHKIEEISLPTLGLTVTIEGDVFNLIEFISKWTTEYSTGTVVSAEITVPLPPGEETSEGVTEEEEEVEEAKPSAEINLLIYSYNGD